MKQNATKNGMTMKENKFLSADATGFNIMANGVEYRLNFTDCPWFEYCTIAEMADFRADQWGVYWDAAEVDLSIESLQHPEKFPVKYSVDRWLEKRRRKAASILGRMTSLRKAAACRRNGKAGGRPKKAADATKELVEH